jgi:hypothetical protein
MSIGTSKNLIVPALLLPIETYPNEAERKNQKLHRTYIRYSTAHYRCKGSSSSGWQEQDSRTHRHAE